MAFSQYFNITLKFAVLVLSIICLPNSLTAQSGEELLASFLGTMNSIDSFRGSITIAGQSGTISYKKPHNLQVKFSDGRIISANGSKLWFYNPARGIAGNQDLRGGTGGLYGLLSGYESVTASGKTLRLVSSKKGYEEIIISLTPNNLLRTIRMRPRGGTEFMEISISGLQTNIGLPASLFNFHPPSNAQVVENALNQRE
ncbi:MAG: outer membrane lipoprotein carrier protein LolA [Leptospiraceae bacterium]|nr:outer membrane lipoprotein carrier protein LolA [Leptospiraceae bacterium]